MSNNSLEILDELLAGSGNKAHAEDAERLTACYEKLSYIIQLDEYTLKTQSGCSDSTAYFLRLCAGLTSRRITDKYKFGKKYLQNEIKDYICGLLFGVPVETVYMLLFDDKERLISCEYIGEGTVNASGVLPRKLIDIAIRKNAKSVILTHNHPCGNAQPSSDDISVTSFIYSALLSADIKLRAHYIVAGFSIADCLEAVMPGT